MPLEDMPWASDSVPVVSDRFRLFLQKEAPRHAQFIEVKVVGPKKLLPSQPYFFVNWLHVVDCIDFRKSEYEDQEPPTDDPNQFDYWRIILDPKKVPRDVLIFRLKYFAVMTIIDVALARRIKKAGLTGAQYYAVDYSIDDSLLRTKDASGQDRVAALLK